MEVDAFTAGVEPGGLNSTRDIKILCCYLLNYVNQPVQHEQLVEALTVTGLVNYFEVASAISELLMMGNVIQDENGYDTLVDLDDSAVKETIRKFLEETMLMGGAPTQQA